MSTRPASAPPRVPEELATSEAKLVYLYLQTADGPTLDDLYRDLDLHGWAFDRFTSMLEYKADERGIDVEQVDERGTSKTCSVCGTEDRNQRVERGLYVCESCGTVANADINGAENVRGKVLPSLAPDGREDNGWMASRKSSISDDSSKTPPAFSRQPAVRLFARSEGRFAPREQVVDCKP